VEESEGITRRRLDQLARGLRRAVEVATAPLRIEAAHVGGEPIELEDALALAFSPFPVGAAWGPPFDTTWFHLAGELPPDWAGRHGVQPVVAMDLGFRDADPGGGGGFGAEGLVWRDGRALQGVSGRHQRIPLLPGDTAVDLHVEAAANPNVAGMLWAGRGAAWTSVPVDEAPLFRLHRCELALVDLAAQALHDDVVLALELLDATRQQRGAGLDAMPTPREAELERALLRLADLGDDGPLREALARPSTLRHRVVAAGHAHMDTAWLWPLRETPRKVHRTVASALRLAEANPSYVFAMSAPQHWAWVEEQQPELWERLKAAAARGQVEPVGAMWVEPDCNLPSGESLVRQITVGQRWWRDHLGVEVKGVFLPDVFGYAAGMPQLLKLAGLDWFCTQKISWNRVNRFPHHSFWWEGIDGSTVFAHFPPADTYNAELTAEQLLRHVHRFTDHASATSSLMLYGYGDGGGGPTEQLLRRALQVRSVEGLPPVQQGTIQSFFDGAIAEAEARGDEVPRWVGELYFEMHRGTFTSQADAKRGNRVGERLLRDAELWSALTLPAGRWPRAELERLWRTLLTLQFHDILPGSSIAWVYEETRRGHAEVAAGAQALSDAALAGDEAVVVNPTGRWRAEVVDGRWVTAPPFSATPLAEAEQPLPTAVEVGDDWAQNSGLRITWDRVTGLLTSVWDRVAEREVLDGNGAVLQLFDDKPVEYDAWDVDGHALAHPRPWTDAERVDPLSDGFVVERSSPSGRSRITQRFRLHPGSRRLDVECDVDWHEDRTLLKIAFPVAVRAPQATFEVQWGAVERPTHRNTTWDAARFEVPAQRWADLSESGYGVAVLNDAKHGYDVLGSTIRLSLLRAPRSPDPTADRGRHRFTVSLLPHAGSWQEGGVVAAAEDLNRPLRIVERGRAVPSALWLDAPGAVVEAVKRPDDGGDGWVVRLYEPPGGRWAGGLVTTLPATTATDVDLMERPLDEPVDLEDGRLPIVLRPFEIRTYLLR
jgi:alpha-mannosidase